MSQTVVATPATSTTIVDAKSTLIIAATIGLLITSLILFIFYRVMQTLFRLKKASTGLSTMDMESIKKVVGGDAAAAEAISTGDDMLWLNLTLVGIVLAYGIGSVVGFIGSAVGLVRAIIN